MATVGRRDGGAGRSLGSATGRALTLAAAVALLAAGLGFPGTARAADAAVPPDPRFTAAVERLRTLVCAEPAGLVELFDPSFLAAVPAPKVTGLLVQLHGAHGAVVAAERGAQRSPWAGELTFVFSDASRMPVRLTLAATPPHLVSGLWFGPVTAGVASFDELLGRLRGLPGRVSFQVARLEGEGAAAAAEPVVLHALRPDEPLAVASAFKLYVLARLVEARTPWDRIVRLDPRLRSLPSGVLQDWPDDAPLTVHSLATQMVSISDNTASDLLIHALGRAQIEEALPRFGHRHVERTVPWLTTRELFALKGGPAERRQRYLAADAPGRRRLLADEVAGVALDSLVEPGGPLATDTLEWFASAADLCRVLDWLRRCDDEAARRILAVNPGTRISSEDFPYVGYKGGSEPGVLSTSWLLRRRDGAWFAVSAIWNDPAAAVDEATFLGLLRRAIELLAREP